MAKAKKTPKAKKPTARVTRIIAVKGRAGRECLIRVNAEGRPGAVERKRYGVEKAASWTEVAAPGWAAATALFRKGAGKKVRAG